VADSTSSLISQPVALTGSYFQVPKSFKLVMERRQSTSLIGHDWSTGRWGLIILVGF
jgi:hypothetical protein